MDLPGWYSSCGIPIFSFAGLVLLAIWWRGEPVAPAHQGRSRERDPGWLFFGMAVLVWATLAVLYLWYPPRDVPYVQVVGSTLNSTFFLFAATSLDYGPEFLQRNLQMSGKWVLLVFIAVLVVLSVTFWVGERTGGQAANAPDLALSFATLSILGFGLFKSFHNRGFEPLKHLAWVVVGYALFSQGFYVWLRFTERPVGEPAWVFLFTSDVGLIMIFLGLAVSWAHERWGRLGDVLVLTGKQDDDRWRVVLNMPERRIYRRDGWLTDTYHELLLAFAVSRVCEDEQQGGWIKLGQHGFGDYRDLGRILEPLGLKGRRPALFQNQRGKKLYRLALRPDDLEFGDELMRKRPDVKERVEKAHTARRHEPVAPITDLHD